MFRYIVLTSIQALQYKRSVSAIYYLLQGKQSIQSIQDANLFGLHPYYGIYKQLSKDVFMLEIKELKKSNYICASEQANFYALTEKGEAWIVQHAFIQEELYFNGMTYRQIDDVFYARLMLMIQVWTNSAKQHRTYVPIVDDFQIENWVKLFYHKTKSQIPIYLQALYDELFQLLKSKHEQFIEIFILQLSGYEQVGMSSMQLAQKYELRIEDIHLITTNITHSILGDVLSNNTAFPVLSQIGAQLSQPVVITHSARKTDKLLQQGWSPTEIATYRHLKINTIYDHLVEIAIQRADFPLEEYVTLEEQQAITHAIEQAKSYTLKEIKTLVDESISYFQIRLVLALWNKFNKRG